MTDKKQNTPRSDRRPQASVSPSADRGIVTNLPVGQIRGDGGTQVRTEIKPSVVDEYAEAMLEGASFPPIVVFHHSDSFWLADGFHRHAAAVRACMAEIRAEVREGTQRDAILRAVGANADHGVRRTNEDKRRAASILLQDEEWGRWSDKEIARQCAVSDRFVGKLRKELSPNGSQIRTVERGGVQFEMDVSGHQSEVGEGTDSEDRNVGEESPDPVGGRDESNEYDTDQWCTPAFILALARKVLGEIDVDPASNKYAQKTVKAKEWHSKEDDGLTKRWNGRVWLNPPYSKLLVEAFTEKLIEEYDVGKVTAAIALYNNNTETGWCQKLLRRFPACFPDRRIPFEHPEREASGPRQGQVVFYLGDDVNLFICVFSELGTILIPEKGESDVSANNNGEAQMFDKCQW